MTKQATTAINSPSLQAFTKLWDAKRKTRRVPSFEDFSNSQLQRFLNQLIVAKVQHGRSYYLFVGSHVSRMSRMDFSGYYLDELDFGEPEANWEEIHCRIIADQEIVPISSVYPLSTGEMRQYTTVLFPFSTDGRTIDHILSIEDWFSAGSPIGVDIVEKVLPVKLRP